jgi:K+-sensing histidine kinase KdpD
MHEFLADSTLFYFVTTNVDGKYSYVNEKFDTTFLKATNHSIGQPFYTLMHPNDIKKCVAVQSKCFENPDLAFTVTIRKLSTKGTYIYSQWECKAMLDTNKNPCGIYCVGYDISKYVTKKIKLKQAQKENVEKETIIKEIVFQQSHLVRAPLTNIMGLVDAFLNEQLLNIDSSSTCEMILESAKQLDYIIRNIVKASRN